MIIEFVQRHQIDDDSWNSCVKNSPNGNIYAYSWYLDIVSPNWGALITPNYSHIFPLPYIIRYGQKIGYHPVFAQQLGLFSTQPIDSKTILLFLCSIPFKKFEYQLNSNNPISSDEFNARQRNNFVLDLNLDYSHIQERYSKSNRKNILKANSLGVFVKEISFEEYWNFYPKHTRYNARKGIFKRIETLIKTCINHNSGFILGAFTADNIICSTLFMGKSHNRMYALFGDSSELGFEQRGKFAIFDKAISLNANSQILLDFEGSNIPSLASFFEGFGSFNKPYWVVSKNKLPKHINHLLKLENIIKQQLKRILKC